MKISSAGIIPHPTSHFAGTQILILQYWKHWRSISIHVFKYNSALSYCWNLLMMLIWRKMRAFVRPNSMILFSMWINYKQQHSQMFSRSMLLSAEHLLPHNIRDCDLLRILVWSLSYKSVVLKGNNEKHHFYVHTLATLPHWAADASSSAGLWQLSLKSFIIRKHIHQAPALPCLLNIIINTVSQLVNSGIKCIFSTQLKRGQEKTIISNENLELICGLRGFLWTPLICIILSMTQIVWNS